MDALSFFALFILIVLAAAIIGFVLLLGYLHVIRRVMMRMQAWMNYVF